jgi:vacuolar protein sorting-associated protein 11
VDLSGLQWRQFSFFTIAPVKDAHDLASSPDIFKVKYV